MRAINAHHLQRRIWRIGEDQIDHTAKEETVRLHIGEAFDIVVEHKKTEQKRGNRGSVIEIHEVHIRNRKSGKARIKLDHAIYPRFWNIAIQQNE
jgi:hypothetical protein